MEKVLFIEHNGKKILFEDFSQIKLVQELHERMAVARAMIHAEPEKSVLALVDVTGDAFNKEMLDAMKAFTSDNTPFMKAVAIVGVQGLLSVAVQTVARVTGREFRMFDKMDVAKDWLVAQ